MYKFTFYIQAYFQIRTDSRKTPRLENLALSYFCYIYYVIIIIRVSVLHSWSGRISRLVLSRRSRVATSRRRLLSTLPGPHTARPAIWRVKGTVSWVFPIFCITESTLDPKYLATVPLKSENILIHCIIFIVTLKIYADVNNNHCMDWLLYALF